MGWAIPIFMIDQLSKWWVIKEIPLNEGIYPIPAIREYFRFYHIPNNGTIFGLLQGADWIFAVLGLALTVALFWVNWQIPKSATKLVRITLGLLIGGAAGNLLDRFLVGHVTDFIDIDLSSIIPLEIADWYIFNVADMAIVTGIILYGYLTLFRADELEFNT